MAVQDLLVSKTSSRRNEVVNPHCPTLIAWKNSAIDVTALNEISRASLSRNR